MELTPEQLTAAQEKLQADGFTIRTAEDDKKYLESNSQAAIDKVFSERNKQLEDLVTAELGIPKNTDEKWFDHFKRAVTTKKTDLDKLSAKIKEYETKGVDTTKLVDEYKAQMETLKQTFSQEKNDLSSKVQTLEQKIFTSRIDGMFEQTLSKFRSKFNNETPYLEDVIANRKSKFLSEVQAKDLEGNIVWQKEGKTLLSKQDGRPVDLDGAMTPYFEDLFQKGKKAAGSGGGKDDRGDGTQSKTLEDRPAEITTQVQLMDHLTKSLKMDSTTKEFAELFNLWKEGLKLR